jgi:hypothetical protein
MAKLLAAKDCIPKNNVINRLQALAAIDRRHQQNGAESRGNVESMRQHKCEGAVQAAR